MNDNSITTNLIWRLLERFGAQGVTLIVSIILARILDPSTYGVVAIVMVITTILQVFIDGGMGNALIQKKDVDDLDYSSVFYFNIAFSIILYILLFIFSPIIANFYQNSQLTSYIRVLGILLLISGLKNVINAYISKTMQFKKYFFATLGGTIIAAIVGIFMAYKGYGAWALIIQNIANQSIDCIILWFSIDWRPKFIFSMNRLKNLLNYGWKLFASSLLDVVWNKMRQIIIGKKYTSSDLAFYDKAESFPIIMTDSLTSSINSVLFPSMSNRQDNIEKVKQLTKQAIKIGSFVIWPIMVGLAVCSDNWIRVILTDKWLPIVPYLKIFCITYAFFPIHTANLTAIKAVGRSDIFLKLEVIKKIVSLSLILFFMNYGIYALAISCIIDCFIGLIINSYPNKKLLSYSFAEQIKDIIPSLILSMFMGVIVYCVGLINLPYLWLLILQIVTGIIAYVSFCLIFKVDNFKYCLSLIKSLCNGYTKNK